MNRLLSLLILLLFISNSMSISLSCDGTCISSCCIEVTQEEVSCCSSEATEEISCCSEAKNKTNTTECCCSINDTEQTTFVHSITFHLTLKKNLNETFNIPLLASDILKRAQTKTTLPDSISLQKHLESPPFVTTLWPTICFRC